MIRHKGRSILRAAGDWIYWRGRGLLSKLQYLLPDRLHTELRFYNVFGYRPNLKSPKTLNEKIQWLKLYDRRPINRICADKVAVRKHVAETLGEQYLLRQYAVLSKAEELTPETLPPAPFVIKGNLDSGSTVIVRDKETADWPAIQDALRRSLRRNHYWKEREWQYGGSERRILVEEALIDDDGSSPPDYKFHCFNGVVKLIQIDQDRQTGHKRILYDRDWNCIEGEWKHPRGRPVERPPLLDEAMRLAERLASSFDYVRIDFYIFNGRLYFGEITFHPQAGLGEFRPASLDLAFGEQLVLTHLRKNPASAQRLTPPARGDGRISATGC